MRADVFAAVAADDSAFSGTRLPQLVPQTGSQSAASQQQTQLTVAHDNAAETRRSQTNSGAWAGGGGGGNASGGGPSSAATHRTAASARSRVGTGKRGAAARPSGAGPIVRVFSRKELDLLRASEAGDIDEVYRLLWDGADVNCKMSCSGSTPLMLACQSGHAKIASVLLEFGALAKTPDEYSATSLHWAANSGSSQLVSLIVGRGRLSNADVSKKDAFGSTALHFASVRNLSGSVMALIHAGCDPTVTNNDGRKPSDLTTDDSIRSLLQEEEAKTARAQAASRGKKLNEADGLGGDPSSGAAGGTGSKGKKKKGKAGAAGGAKRKAKSSSTLTASQPALADDKATTAAKGSQPILQASAGSRVGTRASSTKSLRATGGGVSSSIPTLPAAAPTGPESGAQTGTAIGSKNSLNSSTSLSSSVSRKSKELGSTSITNSLSARKRSQPNTLKGFVSAVPGVK